jgi:O-antigen/teichoic acid export membrane protein
LWQQQKRISVPFAGSFIIACSLIWIAIPLAYPYIYGDAFVSAAIPCALLLTARLVAAVNVVYEYGLWAMGKDKLMLSFMTFCAVASISANLWAIPTYGILGAALINLFAEVFVLLACIVASVPKRPHV